MRHPKKEPRGLKKQGKPEKASSSGTTIKVPVEASGFGDPVVPGSPGESESHREVISRSAEQTFELGRTIAQSLNGAATILLSGDLGAGKTVFAKGIAAGLGIDPADVTSPSFTLINVHDGRLKLYHIDLYRLEGPACAGLGLEEIFEDPEGVVVIEWAERLPWLPRPAVRVQIEYVDDESRRILIWGEIGKTNQEPDTQSLTR